MGYGFGRINDFCDECHKVSKEHGFWEGLENNSIPVKLALIHSEVSEALEEYRKPEWQVNPFTEELADICIRVFDLAGKLNLNLEQAIVNKIQTNKERPFKHGGKSI